MTENSSAVTTVRMTATLTYVPIVACSPCAWGAFIACPDSSRDQVEQREDRDPDDVHEVPVEPGDLDLDRVGGGELPAERQHPQREKPDHTHRDVPAVEAGQHEESRAEEILLEREALVHERRELEHLEAEEDQPEGRRAEEPDPGLAVVAALDGRQREHHQQARHEEVEGRG